jgi:hypothetical protein
MLQHNLCHRRACKNEHKNMFQIICWVIFVLHFTVDFIVQSFTSKLISRNVKLQIYNTLIRPTVTYASETWVLKENMINKLMIFERKVMRNIFGPTRSEDGYWRIRSWPLEDQN